MKFKTDITPGLGHLEEVQLWLDQLYHSFTMGRPLNAAERRRITWFAAKIEKRAAALQQSMKYRRKEDL